MTDFAFHELRSGSLVQQTSVSDDNTYSVALFRTLKYTPAWPPGRFESLNAARQWVKGVVHWSNHLHRHNTLKFVAPVERHEGKDAAILARRKEVYELVKERHPERWSGSVRNLQRADEVWPNPLMESHANMAALQKAAW